MRVLQSVSPWKNKNIFPNFAVDRLIQCYGTQTLGWCAEVIFSRPPSFPHHCNPSGLEWARRNHSCTILQPIFVLIYLVRLTLSRSLSFIYMNIDILLLPQWYFFVCLILELLVRNNLVLLIVSLSLMLWIPSAIAVVSLTHNWVSHFIIQTLRKTETRPFEFLCRNVATRIILYGPNRHETVLPWNQQICSVDVGWLFSLLCLIVFWELWQIDYKYFVGIRSYIIGA